MSTDFNLTVAKKRPEEWSKADEQLAEARKVKKDTEESLANLEKSTSEANSGLKTSFANRGIRVGGRTVTGDIFTLLSGLNTEQMIESREGLSKVSADYVKALENYAANLKTKGWKKISGDPKHYSATGYDTVAMANLTKNLANLKL